jgi:hypothetical protein
LAAAVDYPHMTTPQPQPKLPHLVAAALKADAHSRQRELVRVSLLCTRG